MLRGRVRSGWKGQCQRIRLPREARRRDQPLEVGDGRGRGEVAFLHVHGELRLQEGDKL